MNPLAKRTAVVAPASRTPSGLFLDMMSRVNPGHSTTGAPAGRETRLVRRVQTSLLLGELPFRARALPFTGLALRNLW